MNQEICACACIYDVLLSEVEDGACQVVNLNEQAKLLHIVLQTTKNLSIHNNC